MKLIILRLILLAAALSWGVAIVGVFMPWENAEAVLRGFGAREISHDSMIEYWLRMTSGAFAAIGVFFGMLAANPKKHAGLLAGAGIFLVLEGLALLAHGARLGLPPWPFYADTAACLLGGAATLLLRKSAL